MHPLLLVTGAALALSAAPLCWWVAPGTPVGLVGQVLTLGTSAWGCWVALCVVCDTWRPQP